MALTRASDCKCCECGEKAVAFFPNIDPDIPSYPYCRKCLNKAKVDLAEKLWGEDGKILAIAMQVTEEQNRKGNDETEESKG